MQLHTLTMEQSWIAVWLFLCCVTLEFQLGSLKQPNLSVSLHPLKISLESSKSMAWFRIGQLSLLAWLAIKPFSISEKSIESPMRLMVLPAPLVFSIVNSQLLNVFVIRQAVCLSSLLASKLPWDEHVQCYAWLIVDRWATIWGVGSLQF